MIFIRGKMNARASSPESKRYIIFRRGWLIGFLLLSFESIAGFTRFKVALERVSLFIFLALSLSLALFGTFSFSCIPIFNFTLLRIRMEAITSCYFIWKSYELAFRAYCLWNNFVEWSTYPFIRFVRLKIMTNEVGHWFFSGSSRMSCEFSLTFISSVKSLVSTSFHIRLNRPSNCCTRTHFQWVYKLDNIDGLTIAIEWEWKRIKIDIILVKAIPMKSFFQTRKWIKSIEP